jgi:hypothetical protein
MMLAWRFGSSQTIFTLIVYTVCYDRCKLALHKTPSEDRATLIKTFVLRTTRSTLNLTGVAQAQAGGVG